MFGGDENRRELRKTTIYSRTGFKNIILSTFSTFLNQVKTKRQKEKGKIRFPKMKKDGSFLQGVLIVGKRDVILYHLDTISSERKPSLLKTLILKKKEESKSGTCFLLPFPLIRLLTGE